MSRRFTNNPSLQPKKVTPNHSQSGIGQIKNSVTNMAKSVLGYFYSPPAVANQSKTQKEEQILVNKKIQEELQDKIIKPLKMVDKRKKKQRSCLGLISFDEISSQERAPRSVGSYSYSSDSTPQKEFKESQLFKVNDFKNNLKPKEYIIIHPRKRSRQYSQTLPKIKNRQEKIYQLGLKSSQYPQSNQNKQEFVDNQYNVEEIIEKRKKQRQKARKKYQICYITQKQDEIRTRRRQSHGMQGGHSRKRMKTDQDTEMDYFDAIAKVKTSTFAHLQKLMPQSIKQFEQNHKIEKIKKGESKEDLQAKQFVELLQKKVQKMKTYIKNRESKQNKQKILTNFRIVLPNKFAYVNIPQFDVEKIIQIARQSGTKPIVIEQPVIIEQIKPQISINSQLSQPDNSNLPIENSNFLNQGFGLNSQQNKGIFVPIFGQSSRNLFQRKQQGEIRQKQKKDERFSFPLVATKIDKPEEKPFSFGSNIQIFKNKLNEDVSSQSMAQVVAEKSTQNVPPKQVVSQNPFLKKVGTGVPLLQTIIGKGATFGGSIGGESKLFFNITSGPKSQKGEFSTPTKNIFQKYPQQKQISLSAQGINEQNENQQSSMFDESEQSGSKKQGYDSSPYQQQSSQSFSNQILPNHHLSSKYPASNPSILMNMFAADGSVKYNNSMPQLNAQRSLDMFGSIGAENQAIGSQSLWGNPDDANKSKKQNLQQDFRKKKVKEARIFG